MVSPDEVVLELDHAFDSVWIVFFQEKKKFGLDSCLIVVFFLILNHLNGDHLPCFVIFALKNLAEGSLADQLNQLESEADLVATDDAIVAFTVIEAVIDEALQFCWGVLLILFGKIINFIVLCNFCHFMDLSLIHI